jgi:hypothetical protein
MSPFLNRFRISLLEAFLVVTGFCLALALAVKADAVAVDISRLLLTLVLIAAFVIAMGRPERREVFLSFFVGAVLFLAYDHYAGETGYRMEAIQRQVLAYITVDQNYMIRGSRESMVSEIVTLEIALGVGLLSAWVTRSLREKA